MRKGNKVPVDPSGEMEIIAEASNLQLGLQQDPTEFLGALLPQLPRFGKVEEFKMKFTDQILSCGHKSTNTVQTTSLNLPLAARGKSTTLK